MQEPTQRALERLRADGDGPVQALADQLLERWAQRPLEAVLDPALLARETVALLAAHSADAAHTGPVLRAEKRLRDTLASKSHLKDALPPEAVALAHELAGYSFAPDRAIVLAVLDREPLRKQLKELLTATLNEFGRKLSSVGERDPGKGFSALGALAGAVKKGGGALGSLAGSLTDGVERQLQKRTAEFVDNTMTTLLQRIAEGVSDPRRAADQKAVKLSFVDGVLGLGGKQLARELERSNPAAIMALVRAQLAAFAARPDAPVWLEETLRAVMGDDLKRPVGELLAELGVADVVRAQLRARLVDELRAVFATDAFAAWLGALLAE